jgi:hypothetical protein
MKENDSLYYNLPGMITDYKFLVGTGSYIEDLNLIQTKFLNSHDDPILPLMYKNLFNYCENILLDRQISNSDTSKYSFKLTNLNFPDEYGIKGWF